MPVDHPDFGKLFPCPCRVSELQTNKLQTLWNLSNLQGFERYTFEAFHTEDLSMPPEQRAPLKNAYEVVYAYAQNPEGWLLLQGEYGSGKTHLAAAVANYNVKAGYPVLFITVPDLLDYLRAAFVPDSTQSYNERFEQIRTAPLLILDDLGTENATSWAVEKLFQIFNYRYMTRLPTVITTNRDIESMEPRLRSRLSDSELVCIVPMPRRDYRRSGPVHLESNLNTLRFYMGMTFENFDLRRHELDIEAARSLQHAYDGAREYASAPDQKPWLILTGTFGAGKTHLAAAVANIWLREGHTVLFISVPDLLDYLRAAFSPKSATPYDQRFEEVRTAPYLVLDDLGTESATPWAQEKLYQLFNYRYIAQLPTVITTSRHLEELDPKLGTRLMDVSRCLSFALLAPAYQVRADLKKPPTNHTPPKRRAQRHTKPRW